VHKNAKLNEIKKKILEYLRKFKMDLQTVFAFLDKDKSKGITV